MEHLDIVVVGAGLSGIGAGYRILTELPESTFAILEGRERIGGTWDLFRYPGVRSDSDMHTLGFPFRPWTGKASIAPGEEIRQYIEDTARETGVLEKIRFRTKVVAADWRAAECRWIVTVEDEQGHHDISAQHLYLCSGYYDYDRGHDPQIPGIDDFAGEVVHPQFWPEDLDVSGKRVVVIGSGATAVTLVPALAKDADHVTMLQRSPTWMVALPSVDPVSTRLRRVPRKGADLARWWNVATSSAFYEFCRRAPRAAARVLHKGLARGFDQAAIDDHFTPRYKPWDQRLCVVPNGDLFKAVQRGHASIVTDTIETVTPTGIRLSSGEELAADVIVTATGLRMLPAGGARMTMDGSPIDLGNRFVYRGMLISGVPNLALCVGYTNASWTLRADLSSRYLCRLLRHMREHGYTSFAPVAPEGLTEKPLLDLDAGYILRAQGEFPKQGGADPWVMRQSYVPDRRTALRADVTDAMEFGTTPVRPGSPVAVGG